MAQARPQCLPWQPVLITTYQKVSGCLVEKILTIPFQIFLSKPRVKCQSVVLPFATKFCITNGEFQKPDQRELGQGGKCASNDGAIVAGTIMIVVSIAL